MNPDSSSRSRRTFLRTVRGAAMAAATASAIGLEPLLGGKDSTASAQQNAPTGIGRANEAAEVRIKAALRERAVNLPSHPTNHDISRYPDLANTYSKCLPHDAFGRVDLNAFSTLLTALNSGDPDDFGKSYRRRHAHSQRPARRFRLRPGRHRRLSIRRPASSPRPGSIQRPERRRTPRALLGFPAPRRPLHPIRHKLHRQCRGRRNLRNLRLPGPAQHRQPSHSRSSLPRRFPRRNSRPLHVPVLHHAHVFRPATPQPAANHLHASH